MGVFRWTIWAPTGAVIRCHVPKWRATLGAFAPARGARETGRQPLPGFWVRRQWLFFSAVAPVIGRLAVFVLIDL